MIYQNLYELIAIYIFNNNVVVGSHQELVCMLTATIGAIFVVAIPFLIVWKLVQLILN